VERRYYAKSTPQKTKIELFGNFAAVIQHFSSALGKLIKALRMKGILIHCIPYVESGGHIMGKCEGMKMYQKKGGFLQRGTFLIIQVELLQISKKIFLYPTGHSLWRRF
jgi:hypothetical protein